MNDKPLKVYTPSGVGDTLWVLQKLFPSTTRNFDLYTWSRNNKSSPFLLGLDRINSVNEFMEPFKGYTRYKIKAQESYNEYCSKNASYFDEVDEVYLEANTFLENGNRLETFLPILPTQYKLPWKINDEDKKLVDDYTIDQNVIVLYTSSIQNNKLSKKEMGEWNFQNWIELTKTLFKTYPGIRIAWIGSKHDECALKEFEKEFKGELITYHLDKPATYILPLFRQCKCFISYQSGMSCISMSEDVPTYMMYFNHLDKLPWSICPPSSINNKSIYNPEFFGKSTISDVVNWVEHHLKY